MIKFTESPAAVPVVPTALVQTGEVNRLEIQLEGPGIVRTAVHRLPATVTAKTLMLGPATGDPVLALIPMEFGSRYRAEIPRVAEYPTYVWFEVLERFHPSAGTYLRVLMTSGYAGDSPTWNLEFPDFSNVKCLSGASCPPLWTTLQNGSKTWTVEMFDVPQSTLTRTSFARFANFFFVRPELGQTVRLLTRTGAVSQ